MDHEKSSEVDGSPHSSSRSNPPSNGSDSFFSGPKGNVKCSSFDMGSRTQLFAYVYIEKFEARKNALTIKGWAYCPTRKLESLSVPQTWSKNVKRCNIGSARPDVAERLGLSGAGDSGFELSVTYPQFCNQLTLRFNFEDDQQVHLKFVGQFGAALQSRFVKNIGLQYFKWARPLKWKLGFKSDPIGELSQTDQTRRSLALIQGGHDRGDVVLPVYNGYDFLIKLLPSLLKDPQIENLIIVDDCSSDPRVVKLLEQAEQSSGRVMLIKNEVNLGFLKTANRGISEVTQDFALLNSDVEVPANWLGRLLEPIKRDGSIASTTPFSNAATILSFPFSNKNNHEFNDIAVDEIDIQFQKLRPTWPLPSLPTGVGFCMGMSKAAVDQIGGFDEIFGRGYGEENDWCLRAATVGYGNVAVPNLYVKHFHGGSFEADEKNQLLQKNLQILGKRHPSYHSEVQDFLKEDVLSSYRYLAALKVMTHLCGDEGITLVFDHSEGGGANVFGDILIEKLARSGRLVIVVLPDRVAGNNTLALIHKTLQIKFTVNNDDELWRLLDTCPITEIEINSLMFYHDAVGTVEKITHLSKVRNTSLRLFLHDYHSLCPSHNLIDSKGSFCDLPDMDACRECLPYNAYADQNSGLEREQWIESWRSLYQQTSEVRVFSEASKDLFLEVYPEFEGIINLTPHSKSSFQRQCDLVYTDPPVIGVVGNIGHSKGAEIIDKLSSSGAFKIVILGDYSKKGKEGDGVVCHGSYTRDELPGLIEQYGINLGMIPSIWPETFNFVTDELISLGLPVISFDIGAHAERISQYELGKVIPMEFIQNPAHIVSAIKDFWADLSIQIEEAAESGADSEMVKAF